MAAALPLPSARPVFAVQASSWLSSGVLCLSILELLMSLQLELLSFFRRLCFKQQDIKGFSQVLCVGADSVKDSSQQFQVLCPLRP